MEGGTIDALFLASDDILRSVELRLRSISWCQPMVTRRMIPDGSRIEGAQEQRPAKCTSDRRWYLGPMICVRAPLRASLWALLMNVENHKNGCLRRLLKGMVH